MSARLDQALGRLRDALAHAGCGNVCGLCRWYWHGFCCAGYGRPAPVAFYARACSCYEEGRYDPNG